MTRYIDVDKVIEEVARLANSSIVGEIDEPYLDWKTLPSVYERWTLYLWCYGMGYCRTQKEIYGGKDMSDKECAFDRGMRYAALTTKECYKCSFRKSQAKLEAGRKKAKQRISNLPLHMRTRIKQKYYMQRGHGRE